MSGRNPPRSSRPSQTADNRWLALLLVALGLPIFLLGLGSPALYDPHESLYAEIAREMVSSGDWLTPHLNGTRYLDKPPLFYWSIALAYKALGVSEFSARLPIAIAGWGGILLTWLIGRQLFDSNAGVLAGTVLTTSVGYFVFSRQLLPDMVFAGFTTLGIAGFLRALTSDRPRPRWTILAYISLALAVMTKGILGLFPLAIMAIYLRCTGGWRALRSLMTLWGLVLFAALIVPWHVVIAWQNEGYFWHHFANEQFLRFLGQRHPVDYISLPLPIFFLVLFLWLLPWSPYLALAFPQKRPQPGISPGREGQGRLVLLLWAGMLLIFFSLSRARLPQYSLPAMPAMALLIGKGLDDRFSGRTASRTGLLIATVVSALLPALALFLLPPYLGQYHQVGLTQRAASLIRLVFGLMLGGSGLALLAFIRKRWSVGLLSLTMGMAAAFFFTHRVLVQLEPFRSSKGLAALMETQQASGGRIVLEVEKDDPFEYEQIAGLVFYTGQPVDLLRRKNPPAPSLPLKPTERFLLDEGAFRQLWTSEERVYLVTDSLLDSDGALDQPSTFAMVGQVGNRWILSNRP
jgi:4-amino-4-deoxy-L-arabinose transferase-like glycosyltransferase